MFGLIKTLLLRWASNEKAKASAESSAIEDVVVIDQVDTGRLVPIDENLLERSRTQWQFGDWESLVKLDREIIQNHPDRAKLALLAAAAHLQIKNISIAKNFIRLSREWGCSENLVKQILIAGVHNTLGRASAISGKYEKALIHFENSLRATKPNGDLNLLTKARTQQQYAILGISNVSAFSQLTESNLSNKDPRNSAA